MTMTQCIGHRGYISAMQFLEMNPAYKSSFPAVGAWQQRIREAELGQKDAELEKASEEELRT